MSPADRRRRLADDTARTIGFMNSIILDATRLGVRIPDDITASIHVWRVWATRLDRWADQDDTAP